MNKNADSYNHIAKYWHDHRSKATINKCIVDFEVLLKRNCNVLDVGCGTGYPIANYLVEKGHHVTGIDVSVEMLKYAESMNLPNSKFVCADFLEYSTNQKYDAIICFDSIFHIPMIQQNLIYPKASDLLNPGGYFIFTSGKQKGDVSGSMYGQPFSYGSLDTDEVKSLLAKNRFTIVHWFENYQEKTTGTRDLLVVAQKEN